jgi:hypothetical protein
MSHRHPLLANPAWLSFVLFAGVGCASHTEWSAHRIQFVDEKGREAARACLKACEARAAQYGHFFECFDACPNVEVFENAICTPRSLPPQTLCVNGRHESFLMNSRSVEKVAATTYLVGEVFKQTVEVAEVGASLADGTPGGSMPGGSFAQPTHQPAKAKARPPHKPASPSRHQHHL